MRNLFFISTALVLASCTIDEFNSSEPLVQEVDYINVDSRLWPYFESFENEAKRLNLNIDLNVMGITGEIREIHEDGVGGICTYGSHIANVTVDLNFWNNSSSLSKEFVVFHELGHCVLSRDHYEQFFSNGICKSLMRSGLGTCRDAYTRNNREYYVQELFENANF